MTESKGPVTGFNTLDSLSVDVPTDNVSDNYVSKTLFAVSEFRNVVLGGAQIISGEARERLPVTIVAGFLGSGKTTLLNHILASQPELPIAVMVNEIGEIGIDGDLIVASDNAMLELSNGCICCSINNDLVDAIFRVLERSHEIDHLMVESSGLADPLPIILTFLRSEFRDRVRVDSIIAIADAANFGLDLFDSKVSSNQLRHADIVLLNKCDLVSAGHLALIERKIRNVRTDARILHTIRSKAPLNLILDSGLFQRDQFTTETTAHFHLTDDGFGSVSFASEPPFAVHKFQQFLNAQLAGEVFRGKGILWIAETDKQYIFHLVGTRFSWTKATGWDPRRIN